jgi:hypothetical protein
MKNFKQEEYKKNRNSLRYLITDNFVDNHSTTIENIIKDKVFIKNKNEQHTSEISKIYYEFILCDKVGFITVTISKDHLINAKVRYKKTKEIKTRDMLEVVSLINDVLFT